MVLTIAWIGPLRTSEDVIATPAIHDSLPDTGRRRAPTRESLFSGIVCLCD